MGQKFYFPSLDSGIIKVIIIFIICVLIVASAAVSFFVLSDRPDQKLSPEPTTSSSPTVSPTLTPSYSPTSSHTPIATLTLKIADNETKKPANNVTVIVDSQNIGATLQNGELEIKSLQYGKHRIKIVPYDDQNIFEQEVNVSGDLVLPISINMPNPVFQATVDVKADYITFRELGRISITLANIGQISSQNTTGLVFVYNADNPDTPTTTKMIDFGNIGIGAQPITKEIVGIDSFVWPTVEYVVIVIIDQWNYTPENTQIINESIIPAWFPAQAQNDIYNFINEHPEINGTIAKIILTK